MDMIYPEGLNTGRVSFQGKSLSTISSFITLINAWIEYDFFEPQPIENAAVFVFKGVIHNWADKYAQKMLQRARNSAGLDTHLIIMDKIIPYACSSPAETSRPIPGVLKPDLPSPIINMCSGFTYPHMSSIAVRQLSSFMH